MFDYYSRFTYCSEPFRGRMPRPRTSQPVSDFREWVDFTNTNSNRIQYLKYRFPDYLTKIKKGLYLQPEEKELQYLLHRKKEHPGDIHKGQCFMMCGDFRMYQKLTKMMYIGKYSTKIWQYVDAIDPGYIDSLCEKLLKGEQKQKMADYLCRERKEYQQNLSKQQQKTQSWGKERGYDLSERRSRSRQRK